MLPGTFEYRIVTSGPGARGWWRPRGRWADSLGFPRTSIARYRAAALGVFVARHHLSLTHWGDLRPRLSRSAILINERLQAQVLQRPEDE